MSTVPDHLLLAPLRARILTEQLGVRAVHLHRAGRPELTTRFMDDTVENLYSVSKTVTALAVGIARKEGLLEVDDLLVQHLPVPPGGFGEGVEQVRLHHLLTMTSGNPITVFEDAQRDHPDVASLFLSTDLVREPGAAFEYSNGSVFLLSRLITERTGQSMRDWLLPRLFEPLGILNPQWFSARCGTTWGATGLNLRSGQVARIGRLMLQGGRWEGRQVVPREWVDLMHDEDTWVPTAPGIAGHAGSDGESPNTQPADAPVDPEGKFYGYGVWRCSQPGAWRADGAYGQMLLILPEQQASVAITAHLEGSPGSDIMAAVWEELLPLL